MDKSIKRYDSPEAMKEAEHHAWQRLSAPERMRAVMDITLALYAVKGRADVPRLQRTLVRILRQQEAEQASGATDEGNKERSNNLQRTELTKDPDAGLDDDP